MHVDARRGLIEEEHARLMQRAQRQPDGTGNIPGGAAKFKFL